MLAEVAEDDPGDDDWRSGDRGLCCVRITPSCAQDDDTNQQDGSNLVSRNLHRLRPTPELFGIHPSAPPDGTNRAISHPTTACGNPDAVIRCELPPARGRQVCR